jgi:hypothetical protein
VDYRNLKPGRYIFYVKAVDRDLNYSEPASVQVTVLPPPFYARSVFIIGAILAVFFVPSAVYAAMFVRQRRARLFEPILNPYIVGNPIRSKEMFFGREESLTNRTGCVIICFMEQKSFSPKQASKVLMG